MSATFTIAGKPLAGTFFVTWPEPAQSIGHFLLFVGPPDHRGIVEIVNALLTQRRQRPSCHLVTAGEEGAEDHAAEVQILDHNRNPDGSWRIDFEVLRYIE